MSAVIIQGAACFVTIDFIDSAGESFTPASARYRIDNETGGQQIQDWMALSGLMPTIVITVSAAQNAMLGSARTELHELLVELTDSFGNTDRIKGDWVVEAVVGGTAS